MHPSFAQATIAELQAAYGSRLRPLLLDVSKPEHIDDAFAAITAASQVAGGGQLVGLVNNAGTTYKRPLETADLDSVRNLFDVNVLGVLAVTQKFLPLLRRARGRVVNIAVLPYIACCSKGVNTETVGSQY